MSELLGIAGSHDEQIVPENTQYSIFFEMLRTFDWRAEPFNLPFFPKVLANYRYILVGDPRRRFSPFDVRTMREWVLAGGNLLVTSAMGGDNAPGGNDRDRTNLGEILGGIGFNDDLLGMDEGTPPYNLFDKKLIIDISPLVGVPGTLCYDGGCSLSRGDALISTELLAPENSIRLLGARFSGRQILASNPDPNGAARLPVLLHYPFGKGRITALGSSSSFRNDNIIRNNNALFLNWLIIKAFGNLVEEYINHYSTLPQRHRLLHGYPFPNRMRPARKDSGLRKALKTISVPRPTPLIVGVLPHASCNPMVKGCGFCTFPHEPYRVEEVRSTVASVLEEIDHFSEEYGFLAHNPVKAVYFGGGTANLTPTDQFQEICRKLTACFACQDAEVTLEGVPAYFERENYRYLEILKTEFSAGAHRISMGVQTFDETQIRMMGRRKFGDKECIRRTAKAALACGFQVSGDLLFNLPGQRLEGMKADVAELADIGVSQISLYHLVMFRTLGPEWSKNRDILAALPGNEQAFENWIALRSELLSLGYHQKTLTNFERPSSAPFQYEHRVLSPEANNWLGFGPSAISLFSDEAFDRGVKLINPENASKYKTKTGTYRWELFFAFGLLDMKVMYITRKIALLRLDKQAYRKLFSRSIDDDFAEELHCLSQAGLIANQETEFTLTEKGCFFADTVAGVFAFRKTRLDRMLAFTLANNPLPRKYFWSDPEMFIRRSRMG